jgi:hypothetical protein
VLAQEILTADAIEKFLHEKQMSLLVENGGTPCKTSRNVGGAERLF